MTTHQSIGQLSIGQLSILHSLRDGDDPILRAPVSELIFFDRDFGQLLALGLIQRSGRLPALTLAGIDELLKPGNSLPVALDLYSQPAYLHRMCGTASR
jgi:hypothetical protein